MRGWPKVQARRYYTDLFRPAAFAQIAALYDVQDACHDQHS